MLLSRSLHGRLNKQSLQTQHAYKLDTVSHIANLQAHTLGCTLNRLELSEDALVTVEEYAVRHVGWLLCRHIPLPLRATLPIQQTCVMHRHCELPGSRQRYQGCCDVWDVHHYSLQYSHSSLLCEQSCGMSKGLTCADGHM